jgi:DNA polymerase-3 subunit delta
MIVSWKGDNTWAIEDSLAKLKEKFTTFNLTVLEDPSVAELGGVVRQAPMLATQRLVVVLSTKKLEKATDLLSDFSKIPTSTYLLLFNVKSKGKVEKAIKKYGKIVEFKNTDPKKLSAAIETWAKDYEITFTKDALNLFAFLTGADEGTIKNELSKLPKGKVNATQVNDFVAHHSKVDIFKIIEYTTSNKLILAWASIEQFIEEKQEATLLCAILVKHFRLLIRVKELDKHGFKKNKIGEELKIHPYRAQLLIAQSRKFKIEQLCAIFSLFEDLDFNVKTQSNPTKYFNDFLLKLSLAIE